MQTVQTQIHPVVFDPLNPLNVAQAATMTLAAGGTSDDEVRNEHPAS